MGLANEMSDQLQQEYGRQRGENVYLATYNVQLRSNCENCILNWFDNQKEKNAIPATASHLHSICTPIQIQLTNQ